MSFAESNLAQLARGGSLLGGQQMLQTWSRITGIYEVRDHLPRGLQSSQTVQNSAALLQITHSTNPDLVGAGYACADPELQWGRQNLPGQEK